jgi:Molybdate transporter of MFS superfamily
MEHPGRHDPVWSALEGLTRDTRRGHLGSGQVASSWQRIVPRSTPVQRQVRLGSLIGDNYAVLSGLELGETVVAGLMNLVAAPLGGVPMCRGAGGLAGHVRFGARTGGALVILGGLLLALALFYADSVATVFLLFPLPILGIILFFGGMELAASVNEENFGRAERTVLVVTAGVALWNVGAYLAGLLLYHADQRGLVRLDYSS